MKTGVIVLYLLALALIAFGGWGRFTQAGRLSFDEMAGMVPFFAYWVGIALGVVATILMLLVLFRGGPGATGID